MNRQRSLRNKPVKIPYVHHDAGRVVIRRFDPVRDSLDELTRMLHRAFVRFGGMGLNCTDVDQPLSVTRACATRGACYVSVFLTNRVDW